MASWVLNTNRDVTTPALGAVKRPNEPSMIAAYDEVSSEYLNSLVDIDGSGVPAHRFRAVLLAVGSDGVAVEFEVAERPEDLGHFVRRGQETLVFFDD